jgi:uncharacterized coiled-coil protein SlyX
MGGGYDQHYGLRGPAFEPSPDPLPAQLSPGEVEPYLVQRLRAVGWNGDPVLDLGLAPLLHEATGGNRVAIDRAMTALLGEAAAAGRNVIAGDGLAAWLDGSTLGEDAPPAAGLAEAQLDAIEGAFAEHDRKLARLRRELAELRERAGPAPQSDGDRLDALEARLDQQEAALRHVLERLITFFEGDAPAR